MCFLEVPLACMVAWQLQFIPTACGTFRQHVTKPFTQPAAPDCTVSPTTHQLCTQRKRDSLQRNRPQCAGNNALRANGLLVHESPVGPSATTKRAPDIHNRVHPLTRLSQSPNSTPFHRIHRVGAELSTAHLTTGCPGRIRT